MKNTTETLSYIPPFSYQVVREEIGKHNDKLETIERLLSFMEKAYPKQSSIKRRVQAGKESRCSQNARSG